MEVNAVLGEEFTLFTKDNTTIYSSCVRKWWKESIVYHIYPRSFCDSNGDGIGDLKGITSKLDYIKALGANVIWLGPIYESPNEDNGYDISDYYKIMPEFGTMEDWEELVAEMHKRDMKICMDLVLNHTSSQHEWFMKSRESKDNPYRDYYIWRPGSNGKAPNNWVSFFSGSTWEYDAQTDEYYLHLFSKGQPDLNWENPKVREEIAKLIRFWLDKGVDAFRMDVINVISKVEGLPDCKDPENSPLAGSEYYFNGPKLIEYLRELKGKTFDHLDIFTVGETPCVTTEHGLKYTHKTDGVLSMLFQFEHMEVDIQPGKSKWHCQQWNLDDLRAITSRWQHDLQHGWQSLYLENHDQPRSVSRFGNDTTLRVESAKMLATWLHMLCGTPFVYQGQEIGMINCKYDIKEYNDVETLNMYNEEIQKGQWTHDQIMDAIHKKSRDNNRTPMQWTDQDHAGFTSQASKPWLKVNPSYKTINVAQALQDPNSILHYYSKLIHLRKEYPAIVYGTYSLFEGDHPQVYSYWRKFGSESLLVMCNFSGEDASIATDLVCKNSPELLICNYNQVSKTDQVILLRPYEARVYRFRNL